MREDFHVLNFSRKNYNYKILYGSKININIADL